jgi:ribosomal protein S18 acetylase RimI-like enzyme
MTNCQSGSNFNILPFINSRPEALKWRKMKNRDFLRIETMLRDIEDDYVSACGRFIFREPSKDHVWILGNKKREPSALIINSRSTLMPVLCGMKEIPEPEFLKGFLRAKKIHSIQGLTEEVMVLEKAMEKTGKIIKDIFDYDLMTLDNLPLERDLKELQNLVMRVPKLIDLDKIAPLQAGYEKEEVLPKGSEFSPAASRMNIANISARGKILAAEYNGVLAGKINVSAVSFTRYQLGGVYVHPDFRGLGIARRMTEEFLKFLINQGKGITLFVKKNNMAALKLY